MDPNERLITAINELTDAIEGLVSVLPDQPDILKSIKEGVSESMPWPSEIVYALGEGARLGVKGDD